MTKLSIITVNYNNVKGLQNTQQSIAAQTFHDYEWIVVDGGSTDGSKEFIAEHQAETTWWCSERDGGIYNAMNKGIMHAQGKYLIFMNSGDTLHEPKTLEKVFSLAPDADVFYGDWKEIQPRRFRKICHSPKKVNYYYFATRPLCHQTAFIRTDLLKQSPYDETYRICADWAKWVEMSKNGCSFQYIPVTVCNYFRDGISYHAAEELQKEHKRILSEFYEKEEAEVIDALLEKIDRRLKVIRRLIWLSSALLLISIILAIWIAYIYLS